MVVGRVCELGCRSLVEPFWVHIPPIQIDIDNFLARFDLCTCQGFIDVFLSFLKVLCRNGSAYLRWLWG